MLRTPNITRPTGIEGLLDPSFMARLNGLDLSSRKIFAGKLQGERRSKKRGESVEFADHRHYVVGDDLRHIDWNLFGRLDMLFMKVFLEEEDLSLHLVLDASASSDCGSPNKFLFGQKLCAALAYIGLVNLNRVAITVIGGERIDAEGDGGNSGDRPVTAGGPIDPSEARPAVMHTLRDLRGRRRLAEAGRFLCGIRPGGVSRFDEAAKRIAVSRRGRGVMVIVSDMFLKEGYEQGLRMLVGHGYDLFVLQTIAPDEMEPTLGGDLRLKDIEDADRAEVTISAPLLNRYKKLLTAYVNQLHEFCARRDIIHAAIKTDTPIENIVLEYLRQRGMLR